MLRACCVHAGMQLLLLFYCTFTFKHWVMIIIIGAIYRTGMGLDHCFDPVNLVSPLLLPHEHRMPVKPGH